MLRLVLTAAIALLLLFAIFRLVLPGLEFGLEVVLGAAPRFFSLAEMSNLVGLGAALGLVGSVAAVYGSIRA